MDSKADQRTSIISAFYLLALGHLTSIPLVSVTGYRTQLSLILFAIPVLSLFVAGGNLLLRKYSVVCFFILLIFSFFELRVRATSKISLGLPMRSINIITGNVLYDSSFSNAGNHVMQIYLTEAESVYRQKTSAYGLVTVVGKERAIITSGIRIKLYGKFKDGIFVYKKLQVLDRSILNDTRERLIKFVEKRVMGRVAEDSQILSIMLITGRAEYYGSEIKNLASSCGCMHVLALSGMHLQFVTLPFKKIKNKMLKYFLSVLFACAFVFLAGPRPSLVRSTIMLFFSFLPDIEDRCLLTLIFQIILFPNSFADIGTAFGYSAVFSLIAISPYVKSAISNIGGMAVSNVMGPSVSALLANIPLQMLLYGSWFPVGLIAGPIVSYLAIASMTLGFCVLLFGRLHVLISVNTEIFEVTRWIMTIFSEFPSSGWSGFIALMLFVIVVMLIPAIVRPSIEKGEVK